MTDMDIVKLFLARDENAITESRTAYSRLLRGIALNILHDPQDAEECESDAYIKAWNSIPPSKPTHLCAYLCRLARTTALDMYDKKNAAKRGTGISLDDLTECISAAGKADDLLSENELATVINSFLATLDRDSRVIFVRRYYMGESIKQIAKALHCTESAVKSRSSRTHKRFTDYLKKEGYDL